MRDLIYVAYAKCYCYAAVTNGHFSRMARLRRRLVTQWSTWRKRRSISSSLTYGPQTARILIPSITLSGVPFSSEFITDENSRLWKNWSKQLSLNGKTYRNVSLTVVSMNGVVVLNMLSRMAVGISNIAISLSNSLGCAIVCLLWLSIEQ